MRASQASDTEADLVGSMRDGVLAQKHLLIGEDGSPNNYDLNVGKAGAGGWRTPRHRHNFDQIRFVIKGDYPYAGEKVLPEGWIGYFPESVYYGPQDRPEGLETMVLQFGGASGGGYLSVEGRELANDALKAKGEFKNGIYTYYDDAGQRHNQDASQACFEYATGRKLEFAPARFNDVIVMNPNASEWIPQGAPGVSQKWLGAFTERQAKIGFFRIEEGAVFTAGGLDAIAIMFLIKGRLSVDNTEYPERSAFELMPDDDVPMRALEPSELLCITLHQF